MRDKLSKYPELIFPPMQSVVGFLLAFTAFTGLDQTANLTIATTDLVTAVIVGFIAVWIWIKPEALLPRWILRARLVTI